MKLRKWMFAFDVLWNKKNGKVKIRDFDSHSLGRYNTIVGALLRILL